jgi:hypothetical protein
MFGGVGRGWVIHSHDDAVKADLLSRADVADLQPLRDKSDEARSAILESKEAIGSILSNYLSENQDPYLQDLSKKVRDTSAPGAVAFARAYVPKGQQMSRDSMVISQGLAVAPHQQLLGDLKAIEAPYICARALAGYSKAAADHLQRKPAESPRIAVAAQLGSRAFIGHGQSEQWRQLKDFPPGPTRASG